MIILTKIVKLGIIQVKIHEMLIIRLQTVMKILLLILNMITIIVIMMNINGIKVVIILIIQRIIIEIILDLVIMKIIIYEALISRIMKNTNIKIFSLISMKEKKLNIIRFMHLTKLQLNTLLLSLDNYLKTRTANINLNLIIKLTILLVSHHTTATKVLLRLILKIQNLINNLLVILQILLQTSLKFTQMATIYLINITTLHMNRTINLKITAVSMKSLIRFLNKTDNLHSKTTILTLKVIFSCHILDLIQMINNKISFVFLFLLTNLKIP